MTSGKCVTQINHGLSVVIENKELLHLLINEKIKKKWEIMDTIIDKTKEKKLFSVSYSTLLLILIFI